MTTAKKQFFVLLVCLFSSGSSQYYNPYPNNPFIGNNNHVQPPQPSYGSYIPAPPVTAKPPNTGSYVPPSSGVISSGPIIAPVGPNPVGTGSYIPIPPPGPQPGSIPAEKPIYPPQTYPLAPSPPSPPTYPITPTPPPPRQDPNNPLWKYCLKEIGQFPGPSCNTFVDCWKDTVYESFCGPPLLFNSEKYYCDYAENVNCHGKPIKPHVVVNGTDDGSWKPDVTVKPIISYPLITHRPVVPPSYGPVNPPVVNPPVVHPPNYIPPVTSAPVTHPPTHRPNPPIYGPVNPPSYGPPGNPPIYIPPVTSAPATNLPITHYPGTYIPAGPIAPIGIPHSPSHPISPPTIPPPGIPGGYNPTTHPISPPSIPSPGVPGGYFPPSHPIAPPSIPPPGIPGGYNPTTHPISPPSIPSPGVPGGYFPPSHPIAPPSIPPPAGIPGGYIPPTHPPSLPAPGIGYPHIPVDPTPKPDSHNPLWKYCLQKIGDFAGPYCNTYVTCWDGGVVERFCAPSLLFNPDSHCDYAVNVKCHGKPIKPLPISNGTDDGSWKPDVTVRPVPPTQSPPVYGPHVTLPPVTHRPPTHGPVNPPAPVTNRPGGYAPAHTEPPKYTIGPVTLPTHPPTHKPPSYVPNPQGDSAHIDPRYPIVDPRLKKLCLRPRGQFPSFSCNKYVNCWDDIVIEEECPPGLLFSENLCYCDFPVNVNCRNRTQSTKPRDPRCKADNGAYRNIKNCSIYHVCSDGQVISTWECSSGLQFNELIGACDYQYNVHCGNDLGYRPYPTSRNSEHIHQKIHSSLVDPLVGCLPGTVMRMNKDCTIASLCKNGHIEVVHCPDGLAYDSQTDKCLLPHLAKC